MSTPNSSSKPQRTLARYAPPDSAPPASPDATKTDRIRARAFEIYQRSRNGEPGDAASDWLAAERECGPGTPAPAEDQEIELKARIRGEVLLASGS